MTQLKRAFLVTSIVVMAGLFSFPSMAQIFSRHLKTSLQKRFTANHFILGLQGGIGTTTYKFNSDVPALSNLKAFAEGWNTEIVFGTNDFRVRAGGGNYQFKKSVGESIGQTMLTGKINISPASLFGKSKYFRAYLVSGVDYSIYSFKGITIPPPAKEAILGEPKEKHDCDEFAPPVDPGPPMGDESALMEVSSKTSAPSPKIKKAQINGGLGLEINVMKNGHFFRMYCEGYYGVPLKEIINDLGLNNTKISGQLVLNFGIGIGLSR